MTTLSSPETTPLLLRKESEEAENTVVESDITSMEEGQDNQINQKNILNAVAYVVNLIVTYGIGVLGIGGLPNNSELSDKYPTLITPAGWAFSIWAIIFISQAVFIVAQCFKKYRAHPLVQDGVGYWYVGTCISQAGWSIAFGYEVIWLSLVLMIAILISLVGLLVSQYKLKPGNFWDYVILCFPFAIHCGWIIAATFLNISVLLVSEDVDATSQLSAAILSVAALLSLAVYTLLALSSPEYVVAVVLAWANAGISSELSDPPTEIREHFDSVVTDALENSVTWAYAIILAILCITVITNVIKSSMCSRN
uniref:Uncharacterized protein n=1 Tax=Leptocylindrus danicus TaxID=163516 RepID=A0A7S2LGL1_9STRA|mmetsp:Transcript_4830/g.7024  ORF Transcript_4830/g.7024 Transcript_4830/m.7024 type:complete len:310 (+) Transcript_4830:41-970(+)